MTQLEICAETLQACAAASTGGADRIELCSALSEGGLTPSIGLLQVALATASIPVHVLIRPRSGNFVYTDAEHRSMCLDIEAALALGACGVVVGALLAGGEIDRDRTAEFVRLASGRPVTFHRAFDQVSDLQSALETVIDLGCDRVLTSGGRPSVSQGLPMLQRLTQQAGGRIRIAAGGGVTLANAAELAAVSGLDVHASLRARQATSTSGDPLWNEDGGPTPLDAEAVRALSAIVHRIG